MISSFALRAQRLVSRTRRAYHDITSIPNKRQALVSQGPPGYSAVSGNIATVFGCTGFLGRYLVQKLAKAGTQVVVAYRDEDTKRHLKPMGDLGQIVSLEFDLRNEDQIAECVRHSTIVYNLVGRDYETKNFTYRDVHTTGAQRIAKVTAQSGVPRFVHVSHLNASVSSPSTFYKSKAEGEELVQAAFPGATVIRPAAMYGYEDRLLNSVAMWPILWKLNYGETKIRPVHVVDVAQVLANLAAAPQLPGTFSLPGPSTLSYDYLMSLVASLTFHERSNAPTLPKAVAKMFAKATHKLFWWHTVCPDEIERRYIDDADVAGDWDAFNITPTEIEQHAITYVRRYRSGVNYARPVVFPGRPGPMTVE